MRTVKSRNFEIWMDLKINTTSHLCSLNGKHEIYNWNDIFLQVLQFHDTAV
jgi:hypothetical protein